MPTNYPGGLDSFSTVEGTTHRDVAPTLSTRLNNLQDAVLAIQTELGLSPSSTFSDVTARLNDMRGDIDALEAGGGGGGALTVRESDGSPSLVASILEFGGGVVTNQGGGVARYVPSLVAGSAGWWGSTVAVAASDARASVKSAVLAAGGYVCDGTADQVEINAAIGDIPANKGGRIILSEGTFNLTGTIILEKPGVAIVGMNKAPPDSFNKRGGTLLKWTGATNGIMFRSSHSGDTDNNTWTLLRDLGFDGNQVAGVRAIRWRTQWSTLENISIYDCGGDGVSAEGFPGLTGGGARQLFDNTYRALTIKGCGGIGFNGVVFAGDGQMYDIVVSSCDGGGAYTGGASCQWMNNHFYGNGNYGFRVPGGAARTKLLNTKIEHSGEGAILWEGAQGILNGCSFQGNGTAGAGDFSVRFTGSSNLITGCQIRQETGDSASSADTGLRFDAGASNNLVVGCYFDGFVTKLSNAGGGNKVHGCFGVADLN